MLLERKKKLEKPTVQEPRVQQKNHVHPEFHEHPQHDYDFLHDAHYDNQPFTESELEQRSSRHKPLKLMDYTNPRFPYRPITPQATRALEAYQATQIALQNQATPLQPKPDDGITRVHLRKPVIENPEFTPVTRMQRPLGFTPVRFREYTPEQKLEVQTPTQTIQPPAIASLESANLESSHLEQKTLLEQRKTRILQNLSKPTNPLSAEPSQARKARELRLAYSTRVAQRQQQNAALHMNNLRQPAFDVKTNPLAAMSQYFIDQVNQSKPTRVADQEIHTIQTLKPAGTNLVRTARATGFDTTQLTNAIQRFTDPIANKTVRTGVMSALHTSPALSLEIQRALEISDANLELQRQAFLVETQETDTSSLADRISAEFNNGVPLEKGVQRLLEAHFNTDLSQIRVHTDSTANVLAKKANAIAFTTGKHIFFQTGKFDPTSSSGFELLAHEVTHTIQQASGLVSAGIDSSASLESAAQAEGQKAVSNKATLEQKVNNFNDYMLKPKLENQTPTSRPRAYINNIQRSLEKPLTLQRDPAKGATPNSATTGFVDKSNPRNIPLPAMAGAFDNTGVKLREKASTSSKELFHYPQKALFFVEIDPKAPTWYKARALDGKIGYLSRNLVRVAPEPGARMVVVGEGDNASQLVIKNYANMEGNLKVAQRHKMIAALSYLNPEALPKPNANAGWDEVKALKNFAIWLPSETFAKSLSGKFVVNSGAGGAFTDGVAGVADTVLTNLANAGEYVLKNTIGRLPGGKSVLAWLQRIGKQVGKVFSHPGAFVSHLVDAIKKGFKLFNDNLVGNLEAGMISFLTGSMSGTGVTLPAKFDTQGVVSLGLQAAGLDQNAFKARLGKEIGVQNVARLETLGGGVSDLMGSVSKNGLAGTVMQYAEKANGLKPIIFDGIKKFLVETLIKKAMATIAGLFIPGGGLITLGIKIFDMVSFIIDKAKQFADVISGITNSMADIVDGKIDSAAERISSTIKKFLPVGIGLLANFAGLGKIGGKIRDVLKTIQDKISTALDKLVKFIADKARPLLAKVTSSSTKPVTTKPVTGTKPVTSSTTDSKKAKSLSVFQTFAKQFGVEAKRILKFTDDKTSDDAHDEKVARGLNALETNEQKYVKDGLISIEDAKTVAATTKQNHSIFKSLQAVADESTNKVTYNWTASVGSHSSAASLRRPPYTSDLEPAANEGTRANPFPLDWAKPASKDYPSIYIGDQHARGTMSQAKLKELYEKQEKDNNVVVQKLDPHGSYTLPTGETVGLASQWQLDIGTVIGPLAPTGTTTPGGGSFNSIFEKFGFQSTKDKLQGDHVHEIQLGGQDMLSNLWFLDYKINTGAGSKLDKTSITLKNGKSIKVHQLRDFVKSKPTRQIWFKINSVRTG